MSLLGNLKISDYIEFNTRLTFLKIYKLLGDNNTLLDEIKQLLENISQREGLGGNLTIEDVVVVNLNVEINKLHVLEDSYTNFLRGNNNSTFLNIRR
jgi:hypothetical protein